MNEKRNERGEWRMKKRRDFTEKIYKVKTFARSRDFTTHDRPSMRPTAPMILHSTKHEQRRKLPSSKAASGL